MNLLERFLFLVFYYIIGLIIAGPYTFLARWDTVYWLLAAWILPIMLIFLLILHGMSNAYRKMFWGFLSYCLLPIFFNIISIVFKWAGFVAAEGFFSEYRYKSLIIIPWVAAVGLMAYSFVMYFWHWWFNGKITPPSNT